MEDNILSSLFRTKPEEVLEKIAIKSGEISAEDISAERIIREVREEYVKQCREKEEIAGKNVKEWLDKLVLTHNQSQKRIYELFYDNVLEAEELRKISENFVNLIKQYNQNNVLWELVTSRSYDRVGELLEKEKKTMCKIIDDSRRFIDITFKRIKEKFYEKYKALILMYCVVDQFMSITTRDDEDIEIKPKNEEIPILFHYLTQVIDQAEYVDKFTYSFEALKLLNKENIDSNILKNSGIAGDLSYIHENLQKRNNVKNIIINKLCSFQSLHGKGKLIEPIVELSLDIISRMNKTDYFKKERTSINSEKLLRMMLFEGILPEFTIFYILTSNNIPVLPIVRILNKENDYGEIDVLTLYNDNITLIEITISENYREISEKCEKLKKLVKVFSGEKGLKTEAFLLHGNNIPSEDVFKNDENNVTVLNLLDFIKTHRLLSNRINLFH